MSLGLKVEVFTTTLEAHTFLKRHTAPRVLASRIDNGNNSCARSASRAFGSKDQNIEFAPF
jgi:hypothetical protein